MHFEELTSAVLDKKYSPGIETGNSLTCYKIPPRKYILGHSNPVHTFILSFFAILYVNRAIYTFFILSYHIHLLLSILPSDTCLHYPNIYTFFTLS
jgi:hypothetical protein